MKYSIRGSIFVSDGTDIIKSINKYNLWKLIVGETTDEVTNLNIFNFEIWVNRESEKNYLFEDLKYFVDINNGSIDWHECTHDEEDSKPCVIAEIYRGS